jgi:AmmeMemoRadiSam system protein B/AmmeMemoRadiSam system protein A
LSDPSPSDDPSQTQEPISSEIANDNANGNAETASSEIVSEDSAVSRPLDIYHLSDTQKQQIASAASRFVACSTLKEPLTKEIVEALGDMSRETVQGVFVTLNRGEQLRGCCGLVGQSVAFVDALYQSAKRTATDDRRFPPVARIELEHLSLEVTLLSELIQLDDVATMPDQIKIGTQGLRIVKDQNAGLVLPSVAVKNELDGLKFLKAACRKAGLHEDAWRDEDTIVQVFDGVSIHGSILPEHLEGKSLDDVGLLTGDQLLQFRGIVAQNIQTLMQGGTPSYYSPQLPDGTVNGIVLSMIDAEKKTTLAHLIRISLRPGVALQSSLFELCKTAAQILTQSRLRSTIKMELALTILHDPALHGQVSLPKNQTKIKPDDVVSSEPIENCSLQGVDTSRRAIVAMMGGDRVSVAFEKSQSAEQLVRKAVDSLSANGRPTAIYSMQYLATRPYLTASSAPAAQPGPGIRQPAFAGAFYSQSDSDREDQVAGLLLGNEVEQTDALAIMVPHAGLRYSGRIAADVWKRIHIPETVLIVGPKHTPNGVDWSVAPHRKWRLSNKTEFELDQKLSKSIAEQVGGFQLDSTAHAREHGAEVQLPFLDALAPKTKLVVMAMHGGTWGEIQETAKQLAECLSAETKLPLLAISSDMNHFATRAENKRRDKLAIAAMKTGDPKELLAVCEKEQISMCGALPAALVMQTLIELGKPFVCEDVSYTTSADNGGDANRVVGYAGMILKPA